MTEQDEIYALMDCYNGMIEPIESWATGDIVKLIRLLDAELQRRHHDVEHFVDGLSRLEATDEFGFN